MQGYSDFAKVRLKAQRAPAADPCGGLSGSTDSGNRPKSESDEMGQSDRRSICGH
jgi:hypothetical protein